MLKLFKHIATANKNKTMWPKQGLPFLDEEEPKFLFIMTPPYSGSTALIKILNTSPNTMMLNEKGEGHHLIPGLRSHDRWEREKLVDWDSVRATYLSRYSFVKSLVGTVDVILEKSPPNLVRADAFKANFPNSSFLVFNRNPYANCSSIFHRMEKKQEIITEEERQHIFRDIAQKWLFRSEFLKKWVYELDATFFTYENLCANTDSCVSSLVKKCPELQGINTNAAIRVKDYKKQTLSNQNPRQLSWLKPKDFETITSVISTHDEILSFFGYEIM